MFDMHCHLGGRSKSTVKESEKVCLISRSASENYQCVASAQTYGVACALFAAPDKPDWDEVCRLVSSGNVLAYLHCELLSLSKRWLVAPLLNACHNAGLPLIIHVSRHDNLRYSITEAGHWFSFLRESWPEVQLIVSHIGGENMSEVLRFMDSDPDILVDLSRLSETTKRAGLRSDTELLDNLMLKARMTQLLFGSDRAWPSVLTSNFNLIDVLCKRLPDIDICATLENNSIKVLKNLNIAGGQHF